MVDTVTSRKLSDDVQRYAEWHKSRCTGYANTLNEFADRIVELESERDETREKYNQLTSNVECQQADVTNKRVAELERELIDLSEQLEQYEAAVRNPGDDERHRGTSVATQLVHAQLMREKAERERDELRQKEERYAEPGLLNADERRIHAAMLEEIGRYLGVETQTLPKALKAIVMIKRERDVALKRAKEAERERNAANDRAAVASSGVSTDAFTECEITHANSQEALKVDSGGLGFINGDFAVSMLRQKLAKAERERDELRAEAKRLRVTTPNEKLLYAQREQAERSCEEWRERAKKAEERIDAALEAAGGRWAEWGERALSVVDILSGDIEK